MIDVGEKLVVTGGGVVYRNSKPHVESRHAYFPSVVYLGSGELLCSVVIGEAFESADCRIYLARSRDYGQTWDLEGRMFAEDPACAYSEACRIVRCVDGTLVADIFRYDRHRPGEGLANPDTLGFVETEISVSQSVDKGRTWSKPEPITPPIVGPEFELCSPIVELQDGRWLLPTSTWKAWDGSNPTGMKAVAFVSYDRGRTWPKYIDVMNGISGGTIHWEHKVVEIESGRLLAVSWAYDELNGKHLTNAYSISRDGKTFPEPDDTGLSGQTASILPLGEDRVLCVYRRTDTPGLWAAEVSIAGDKWQTERQFALWGAPDIFPGARSQNIVHKFNVLKFGCPTMVRLDNGDIFIVFWCVEDCVSNIRWIRLGG